MTFFFPLSVLGGRNFQYIPPLVSVILHYHGDLGHDDLEHDYNYLEDGRYAYSSSRVVLCHKSGMLSLYR